MPVKSPSLNSSDLAKSPPTAAAEELSWPADAAALRGVYDRIATGPKR
jgi:hypothetical protein